MTHTEWTSLADAGITYGDTFALHGDAKAKCRPVGRPVRVEATKGQAYRLVDATTGDVVDQATSLKRAKWWVAR